MIDVNIIKSALSEHISTIDKIGPLLEENISIIANLLTDTVASGKRIYIFGNGGSAADAQHIAAELVGRFVRERKGLPVFALTTDSSVLTAVGNDYGYEQVFARQVEALAREGDVLVAISTSGNSANVVEAAKKARELGVKTVALTGGSGGALKELSDLAFVVPSVVTARIQEAHILIGHILCELIDSWAENEKPIA